ncbi:MAG: hypothetical protein CSB21_02530 [Deltaproteobacteria bacterium]|nr:MAG: hypothetical protein CSB21_02530 [Deltaproteobacteria bacterium]
MKVSLLFYEKPKQKYYEKINSVPQVSLERNKQTLLHILLKIHILYFFIFTRKTFLTNKGVYLAELERAQFIDIKKNCIGFFSNV